MELLLFLLTIIALIWSFNKLKASKNRTKLKRVIAKEEAAKKTHDSNRRALPVIQEDNTKIQNSIEPPVVSTSSPASSIEDQDSLNQSKKSLEDHDLHQILKSISTFPAVEVFNSISTEEQLSIREKLKKYSSDREQNRYSRLETAEIEKEKVISELEELECTIQENDSWFVAAKEGKVDFTNESRKQYTQKAGELYSRKDFILKNLLPATDLKIKTIISEIESEERQEMLAQGKDLEHLLRPFHEKREHVRRQAIVADTKEKNRLREEKEAREREQAREQNEQARKQNRQELFLSLYLENLEKPRIPFKEQRKKRADDIRALVHERKIPYLVHFTPIANVESILKYGLRSRNALSGHKYVFTDEYRLDGWLDWISLSVSFPNYKMFYKKRKSLDNVDGWAILLIKKEVLWELDCKFILRNAASSGIRMFQDDKWSSVEAFEDMFNYVEHRHNIPKYYTTDPQAEVMVRNEVSRDYIDVVAVEGSVDAKRLVGLEDIPVKIVPQLFEGRSDFVHWR